MEKRDMIGKTKLAGKKMFSLARFLELYLLWVLESTEVPRTTGTTQTDPGFG